MEQPQRHVVLGGHVAEHALRPMDRPCGGGDAAVLVRVGVAEHHLLQIAPQRDHPPVRRLAQQVVEQRPGRVELVDGLEQRHEVDARHAGAEVDEPCVACEHGGGEDVVDALDHRDDVALDRFVAVAVEGLPDHGEDPRGPRCVLVERRGRWCERSPAGQLLRQQPRPPGTVQRPVVIARPEPIEQRTERVVVTRRVLTYVHGRELQAH